MWTTVIDILREAKEQRVNAIADIDRAIVILENRDCQPNNRHSHIQPGQYHGLEINAALQAYLVERGRGPVPLTQAIKDLVAAETKTLTKYVDDLGQARKYLTITIRHNKGIFGFDKKKDLVWLVAGDRESTPTMTI